MRFGRKRPAQGFFGSGRARTRRAGLGRERPRGRGFVERHGARERFGGAGAARGGDVAIGRLAAHDIGFDQDVGRAADHDQVFDIVAAHDHELAAAIDGAGFDHRETRLASARGGAAEAVGAEAAHEPGRRADQREYDDEGDEEAHREWCLRAEKVEHKRPRARSRVGCAASTRSSLLPWIITKS